MPSLAERDLTAERAPRWMSAELETLDKLCPGLRESLAARPFEELESHESPAIEIFRRHGGPNLLVPAELGGLSASAVEAVRFQRAIGFCCPSLAVGTAMHHFSVATLVDACTTEDERELVRGMANERMLIASGFAEGRSGQSFLEPTMVARRDADGYRVSGRKKPCSLSRSMDLLTASVQVVDEHGSPEEVGVALIPAQSEGITRKPFWATPILAGAQSDEVILEDVFVPADFVVSLDEEEPTDLSDGVGLGSGFLWFQVIICASYLGIADRLLAPVLTREVRDPVSAAMAFGDLRAAATALEAIAERIADGAGDDLLADVLLVRAAVQGAVQRTSVAATELLGGISFITSPETGYLVAAAQAITFHPPSRRSASGSLIEFLTGGSLELG
jgi:alkylation response protein AidB-like acyl-CoA dehydrogenase